MFKSLSVLLVVSLVSVRLISGFLTPHYDCECAQLYGGKGDCEPHQWVFECSGHSPISNEDCPGWPLLVKGAGGLQSIQFKQNLACTTPIADESCGTYYTNYYVQCDGVIKWWNGTSWVILDP